MNKTLWIMAGLPGSGKSTFAQNHLMKSDTWAYVSRDIIRFSIIKSEEEYFSHEKEVYNQFINQINNFLIDEFHTDIIADATHLNWPSRYKLLCKLYLANVTVNIVWMETDYTTCLARNDNREGRARVPKNVMWNMYNSYTHPREDNYKYNNIYNAFSNGDMHRERIIKI